MRKPIGLFVAAFATVAGGGLAFAAEEIAADDPPATEELPVDDSTDDTDDTEESEETDDLDDLDDDDDADDDDDDADDDADDDPAQLTVSVEEPTTEEESHGEWVSRHAQEDCAGDEEVVEEEVVEEEVVEEEVVEEEVVEEDVVEWRNHGECVSAAARDHDHDGTPDHGPGSANHPVFPAPEEEVVEEQVPEEESAEVTETETSRPGNGNGRGNGGGQGGGRGRGGR